MRILSNRTGLPRHACPFQLFPCKQTTRTSKNKFMIGGLLHRRSSTTKLRFHSQVCAYSGYKSHQQLPFKSFLQKPSAFHGANLIFSHQNVPEALKIYNILKEKRLLNIKVASELMLLCSKKNELQALDSVVPDIVALINKMSDREQNEIKEFTWNIIISGMSDVGRVKEALMITNLMSKLRAKANVKAITKLLNACSKVKLIDEAMGVFYSMEANFGMKPDIYHFSCLMKALVESKRLNDAMNLLQKMKAERIKPDSVTFVILLKGCAEVGPSALDIGKQLHDLLIDERETNEIAVNNALVNMYCKCGSIEDALTAFNNIGKGMSDIVTWTTLISGLGQHGRGKEALETFETMQQQGIRPENQTFVCILSACGTSGLVHEAIEIFKLMGTKYGITPGIYHYNCLMKVLVGSKHLNDAMNLLQKMKAERIKPDSVTFVILLKGCAEVGPSALDIGKQLHDLLIDERETNEIAVNNALVNMYCKCGSMEDALTVFKSISKDGANVECWTSLISGLGQHGRGKEALEMYQKMQQQGLNPDDKTLSSVLNACGNSGLSTTAVAIFESMPASGIKPGIYHYNCLMKVLVGSKRLNDAVNLLQKMKRNGIKPDSVTFVILLKGCAKIGTSGLSVGKQLNELIVESKISEIAVNNALVNMYCKCGSIEDALTAFNNIGKGMSDIVTWTTLISGLGQHGRGKEALETFETMQQQGIRPERQTFVCVLNACSHSGLVTEALTVFDSMKSQYGIEPDTYHLNCVVDLLGRANYLNEAEQFIINYKESTSITTWRALLGACRAHKDLERAERVYHKIVDEIDPSDASAYVLMSNIYYSCGNMEAGNKVRELMKMRGVKKIPGITTSEVNGQTYSFTSGHIPEGYKEEILKELEELFRELDGEGYVPDTSFVTRDTQDEKEKRQLLCLHSEKIAIAFNLISTPEGTPIYLTNNLRVCGDCHNATAMISKVRNREIIVRDASRYHHFKDGKCSCGDYW